MIRCSRLGSRLVAVLLWVGVTSSVLIASSARAADPILPPLTLPEETDPTFPDARTRRMQLGLTRADRIQHASLSFAIGLSLGLTTREPAAAAGALVVGLVKEVWDQRRGLGFDGWDLVADALGAAAGAGATAALQDQE